MDRNKSRRVAEMVVAVLAIYDREAGNPSVEWKDMAESYRQMYVSIVEELITDYISDTFPVRKNLTVVNVRDDLKRAIILVMYSEEIVASFANTTSGKYISMESRDGESPRGFSIATDEELLDITMREAARNREDKLEGVKDKMKESTEALLTEAKTAEEEQKERTAEGVIGSISPATTHNDPVADKTDLPNKDTVIK